MMKDRVEGWGEEGKIARGEEQKNKRAEGILDKMTDRLGVFDRVCVHVCVCMCI